MRNETEYITHETSFHLFRTPLAITTPMTTGTRVAYTSKVSVFMVIKYANTAVKNGVVAPIARFNDTGRYLSEMFPLITEAQKTKLSTQILKN